MLTAMRLPDDAVAEILECWPVARLATLGSAGPEQVPVVFAHVAGRLWSPVDGKPKRGGELARVRNLRADPRASLLLDAYDDDWSRLWWLRVATRGEVIRPAHPASPEIGAVLAALRTKYPQYEDVPVLREPPTLLRFEVLSLASWCAGPQRSSRATGA